MKFRRNSDSHLEAHLRRSRPEPSSDLVRTIVGSIERASAYERPRSLRVAFAVGCVVVLGGLAAFGGVSYAASGVEHAALAVKHVVAPKALAAPAKTPDSLIRSALAAGKTSAAAQYGPTLPPGTTAGDVVAQIKTNADTALDDLVAANDCSARSGRAKTACENQNKLLSREKATLNSQLQAISNIITTLNLLPAGGVNTMLAIHLQETQTLQKNQAARAAACKAGTFPSKTTCKNLAVKDAQELLRLATLQARELLPYLRTLQTSS